MPPLRCYTMGMIRRSFAFPPRARNKAAGGRAKGGRGTGGDSRLLPVAPRLPARGSASRGVGAGRLQSSDPEGLWRAPGHPPGQVRPRAAVSEARPPPRPSLPRRQRVFGTGRIRTQLRAPQPSGQKLNTKCPRLQWGRWAFSMRATTGPAHPAFLR